VKTPSDPTRRTYPRGWASTRRTSRRLSKNTLWMRVSPLECVHAAHAAPSGGMRRVDTGRMPRFSWVVRATFQPLRALARRHTSDYDPMYSTDNKQFTQFGHTRGDFAPEHHRHPCAHAAARAVRCGAVIAAAARKSLKNNSLQSEWCPGVCPPNPARLSLQPDEKSAPNTPPLSTRLEPVCTLFMRVPGA
jgi:hypothetical protein